MIDKTEHISIICKELFIVKFLHTGYSGANRLFISSGLSIKPDTLTRQLLINHNMGYRFFTDSLLCFMQCDLFAPPAIEPKIPHIKFTGDVRIRFTINTTTDFVKRTDVAVAGAKQMYQFSNQSNAGTDLFISRHEEGVNNDDLKDVALVEADETCFAVLDIYNNGLANDDYALFNDNGTLVNTVPVYQVRFRSKI